MKLQRPLLPLLLVGLVIGVAPSSAILLMGTNDPTADTAPPTGTLQGSGWQFEGEWNGVLGTSIGAQCFLTAEHVGGNVGDAFVLGGRSYVTDRVTRDPNSDLAVWHVTKAFPGWATLYRSSDEVGRSLVVFGRGTERGPLLSLQGKAKGWAWGPGDAVTRWGTNTISGIKQGQAGEGSLLAASFDLGAQGTEAYLSSGDSGGGVFLRGSDNVWRLAGVNSSVDGYYATNPSGALLNPNSAFPGLAALFDQSGFYVEATPGTWNAVSGPGRWYATRISSNLPFVDAACAPQLPPPLPACSDGFDNDGDGFIDYPDDPGCASAISKNESPACQDGIDNDLDGKIDFDGGASANHGVALGPPDPQCARAFGSSESVKGCGIGAELVFVVGGLLRWRSRRRLL
jgi:hypothetical protein